MQVDCVRIFEGEKKAPEQAESRPNFELQIIIALDLPTQMEERQLWMPIEQTLGLSSIISQIDGSSEILLFIL